MSSQLPDKSFEDEVKDLHSDIQDVFGDTPEPVINPNVQSEDVGGAAPINLYIGHLSTKCSSLREQYDKPLEGFYYLVSLDSFGKGYSNGTITKHEFPALKSKADRKRISKSRTEMSEEDRKKSTIRAKKELRKKTIMLKPINMLTLTFKHPVYEREKAYKVLHKFVRDMNIRFGKFDYVAVAERHKKGDFHFHLAINEKYHWNTVRYLWRKATGTGEGNTHFSDEKFRGQRDSMEKSIRIAGYICKYFSKDDVSEICQKRYSSSRGIPKPRKERFYIPITQYTFELVEELIQEVTGKRIKKIYDIPDSTITIRWISTF